MSIFRLVEGWITTRPKTKLGNAAFDTASYSAEVDHEFDLGGLRKDIHLEFDKAVLVKLGSSAVPGATLEPGSWDYDDEFTDKVYITFFETTNLALYANG